MKISVRNKIRLSAVRFFHGSLIVYLALCSGFELKAEVKTEEIPDSLRQRAIDAKNHLFKKLSGKLIEVISSEGPAKAIHVCGKEAIKMAKQTGKEFELKIGRTALKLRNPKNTPPKWALPILKDAQQTPLFKKVSKHKTGALFPIRLKAQCLVCHGEKEFIPPIVQQKLKEKYPKDKAIGFEVEDLRGWFWVEMNLKSKTIK